MGGKPSIARAYAEQSKADFRKFLHCRAAELKRGGILQCYFTGRADLADPTNHTIPERRYRFMTGPDFENAWEDLIAEARSHQSHTYPNPQFNALNDVLDFDIMQNKIKMTVPRFFSSLLMPGYG